MQKPQRMRDTVCKPVDVHLGEKFVDGQMRLQLPLRMRLVVRGTSGSPSIQKKIGESKWGLTGHDTSKSIIVLVNTCDECILALN